MFERLYQIKPSYLLVVPTSEDEVAAVSLVSEVESLDHVLASGDCEQLGADPGGRGGGHRFWLMLPSD